MYGIFGKRETNISFTPKPPPILTSSQRFPKMFKKPFVLSVGLKSTSLALPRNPSSSQIESSTYQVLHPTILFAPLP
jgi:hypothetical protein